MATNLFAHGFKTWVNARQIGVIVQEGADLRTLLHHIYLVVVAWLDLCVYACHAMANGHIDTA